VLAAAEQGTLVLVGQSGEVVVVTVEDRPAIDAVITATLDDPELPAAWRALDTVLLHHVLLPAWGMAEADVTYHHDAAHAVELARNNGGTAVLMAPVDVRDVFALAETGVRMPRKSTSFGPKPRSGLVLRTFADDQ
jgi:hypothetical protein